jgi:DNA gyrase/topoisomerase IV subunit A
MTLANPLSEIPRSISEEMQESYLTYAMSVIMARALPDVRDGLKPSQRRILVAMHDLNLTPRSKHRMGQEWSMSHLLVDPQARRYTTRAATLGQGAARIKSLRHKTYAPGLTDYRTCVKIR